MFNLNTDAHNKRVIDLKKVFQTTRVPSIKFSGKDGWDFNLFFPHNSKTPFFQMIHSSREVWFKPTTMMSVSRTRADLIEIVWFSQGGEFTYGSISKQDNSQILRVIRPFTEDQWHAWEKDRDTFHDLPLVGDFLEACIKAL